MKKKILLLMGVFSLGLLQAQVGVNTQNPLGVFHVDPLANTTGTVAFPTNDSDDVIVTADGRVGIGTVNPQAKVHLISGGTTSNPIPAFRLEDGNQLEGKFLISDINGVATWDALVDPSEAIYYNKPSVCPDLYFTQTDYSYTNSNIELSPGRWLVSVTMYVSLATRLATDRPKLSILINTTFSEAMNSGSFNTIKSPDVEGSPLISIFTRTQGILYGAVVINNKTNSTKTYYYMAGDITIYGSSTNPTFDRVAQFGGRWGEDNIVAYRMPNDLD